LLRDLGLGREKGSTFSSMGSSRLPANLEMTGRGRIGASAWMTRFRVLQVGSFGFSAIAFATKMLEVLAVGAELGLAPLICGDQECYMSICASSLYLYLLSFVLYFLSYITRDE